MKVLLVNTYDNGGAAKACIRLHEGLLKQGIDSKLLLLFSKKQYPEEANTAIFSREFPHESKPPSLTKKISIKLGAGKRIHNIRAEIEKLPASTIEAFSEPYSTYDFTRHPWYKGADIVHLHWASGFLDYSFFSKNSKPVVWTLHDMNAFTGGCHYSGGCTKYVNSCDYCHYLKTTSYPEYTDKLLNYKKKHIHGENALQVVSPSRWLANTSQASALLKKFKHSVIPYGIDSTVFKPYPKKEIRSELGLPKDKKILLFVAERIENHRKGGQFIFEAQKALHNNSNIIMCSVGKTVTNTISENYVSLGEIQDEAQLAKIYSAADALLIPSIEDNLPNTALEAILCGTPLIAFPVGGLPDIISHGNNGLICSNISSQSLIECINAFLQNGISLSSGSIRENAVAKYDLPVSAKRYISLYQSMLSK